MKPVLSAVLGALSARVFGEMMPVLPAGYRQSDALIVALLLAGAAEEHERAADVRHTTVEEFRAVFARASEALPAGPLRDAVSAAADTTPASLRISDLDACGDKLSAVLIELHAYVEERGEQWAREIERDIWATLRADSRRRAFVTSPF
jgi:hypothetical protein